MTGEGAKLEVVAGKRRKCGDKRGEAGGCRENWAEGGRASLLEGKERIVLDREVRREKCRARVSLAIRRGKGWYLRWMNNTAGASWSCRGTASGGAVTREVVVSVIKKWMHRWRRLSFAGWIMSSVLAGGFTSR